MREASRGLYELLLWLHVTGAVIWVGGGVISSVMGELARRSDDDAATVYLFRHLAVLGPRLLAPLSGLTGLFGVLLVATHDAFTFREVWVGLAFALWMVSSIVGGAYVSPRLQRLIAAIGDGSRLPEDQRATANQVLAAARLDAVVLLAVVFLMTVKPGAWPGTPTESACRHLARPEPS